MNIDMQVASLQVRIILNRCRIINGDRICNTVMVVVIPGDTPCNGSGDGLEDELVAFESTEHVEGGPVNE